MVQVEQSKDMEERAIILNRQTARDWYYKGGALQDIALQAFNITEILSQEEIDAIQKEMENDLMTLEVKRNMSELFQKINDHIEEVYKVK